MRSGEREGTEELNRPSYAMCLYKCVTMNPTDSYNSYSPMKNLNVKFPAFKKFMNRSTI